MKRKRKKKRKSRREVTIKVDSLNSALLALLMGKWTLCLFKNLDGEEVR
jgi:uncharacterized protein (DUF2141 family)